MEGLVLLMEDMEFDVEQRFEAGSDFTDVELPWTGSMMAIVLDFVEEALILSIISRGKASLILWLGTAKEVAEFECPVR